MKKKEQEQDLTMPGEEGVIGENTYMVRMLPMRDWFELETLLMRVAGSSVAEFFSGGKGFKSVLDIDTKAVGAALYAFTSRADAKEHAKFLEILGGCTWVNGKILGKNGQNAHWPRHMGELAGYIKHALSVQFADFISGLQSELPFGDDAD